MPLQVCECKPVEELKNLTVCFHFNYKEIIFIIKEGDTSTTQGYEPDNQFNQSSSISPDQSCRTSVRHKPKGPHISLQSTGDVNFHVIKILHIQTCFYQSVFYYFLNNCPFTVQLVPPTGYRLHASYKQNNQHLDDVSVLRV